MVATVGGMAYGGLYLLATKFEPEQQDVSKPLPSVKIRKQ